MSESGDYTPGAWASHDFGTARSYYDSSAGRSYSDAVNTGKNARDLVAAKVSTKSSRPLVIVVDVTGSMGEWPATMFSKLPFLELGAQHYLGKDLEICFAAVGDAYCDKYPLQSQAFTKGTKLKGSLEKLVIEGGGGGQTSESYELPALYFARNCSMPRAVQPIIIFVGDEKPYDFVNEEHAKELMGVEIPERFSTAEVFKELRQKFAVYLIRKPYERGSGNVESEIDQRIRKAWDTLVGDDHIADLPEPGRVVDVILGILAKETGLLEDFAADMKDRQTKAQQETVFKSLKTIHKTSASKDDGPHTGKSIMRVPAKGKKTGKLI